MNGNHNSRRCTRRAFIKGATLSAAGAAGFSGLLASEKAKTAIKDTEDTMELQVDHISFPVYNNFGFLEEVEENWKTHGKGEVSMGPENPQYKGVFYRSKNFYVEHLSTAKGDGYWSNTIYLVVDRKHWDYYENPESRNEHWLKPRTHGGFAIFPPDSPLLNWRSKSNVSYDGHRILISETLEAKLTNLCGLKWKLPSFITTHKELHHAFDMVVIDENDRLIAPLYQSNYPLNYW